MRQDHCSNCQAALTGPYCAQCGQHAHDSARPLHAVLHEAWHIFTHVDGSLWRTLRLLFTRPGALTQEYFAGRRTRYSPPFRLYFVVSLVFFGLGSLTNSSGLSQTTTEGPVRIQVEGAQRLRDQSLPGTQELQSYCRRIDTGHARMDSRLQALCDHQAADRGLALLHEFTRLLPRMMFVFLPLMAAVMMLAYRAPRHYYVEHLVFLLHAQSAVFLVLLAITLLALVNGVMPAGVQAVLLPVAAPVLTFYYVWYVYAALRRFYAQGRALTFAKYCALGLAYCVLVGLSAAATLVISALVT